MLFTLTLCISGVCAASASFVYNCSSNPGAWLKRGMKQNATCCKSSWYKREGDLNTSEKGGNTGESCHLFLNTPVHQIVTATPSFLQTAFFYPIDSSSITDLEGGGNDCPLLASLC